MPTVAIVDGVRIRLYNDEHWPSHFHAIYAEHEAVIGIDDLKVLEGSLPRAQLRKVLAWASTRQRALFQAWMTCQADANPGKIP